MAKFCSEAFGSSDNPPSYEQAMASDKFPLPPEQGKPGIPYAPQHIGFQAPFTSVVVPSAPHFADASVVTVAPVGPKSMHMLCPHCNTRISTRTRGYPSVGAWIASLLLCFICPIASCIPCCMEDCMNVDHSCPNCNNYIATYTRS